ncbi:hypothetical protein CC78DRAFT_532378 [Lojkania enalia]|uniref:Uncharacterized protein n=1 Tax=Lojkania enalia TaxID=147567 RepID=A0A9P4KD40_9PLEO|nr:hypothetical protein CC78DRAFT_532378 [Didymosphaeria enalia]
MDAALERDRVCQSTSWLSLVSRADEKFLNSIVDPCFLTQLNIAHIHLLGMEGESSIPSVLAKNALNYARYSINL